MDDKSEASGKKDGEISFDVGSVKEGFGKAKKFFMRKDVQIVLTVAILLGVIIFGTSMRVQNLELLKDSTTGEYIPLALDPFYFMRVAETILENGGLPSVDEMRYPAGSVSFTHEILPWTIVGFYKIANVFGDFSFDLIGILSPVIFYILGLIAFFFLCYTLTKSKISSIIASIFLAFIPTYLYRTLAGFVDHEAPGMFAFFLVLLGFAFSVQKLDKEKIKKYLPLGLGAVVGFLTAFTVASWGGLSNFVFMILPLSMLIIWVVKTKEDKNNWKKYLLFYVSWIVSSLIFGPVLGMDFGVVLGRLKTSTGLISLFTLAFICVDSFLIKKNFEERFKKKKDFYRVVYSVLISIGLGIIFLLVQGNLISVVKDVFVKVLNPFGSAGGGRLGATVAENASPYLSDWMNQTGKIFFWISMLGLVLFGLKFFEKIPREKDRVKAVFFWILLIAGIFFSRYASDSLFNGDNFISKLLMFGSIALFVWFFGKLYYKNELKLDSLSVVIFSWMILMLIGARGAVRLLFVISPFFCFIAGWNFGYLIERLKEKDELKKLIVVILLIGVVIASFMSISNFMENSNVQAQNTGPSANAQWQSAMSWVRDNTDEDGIFVHWWDYGYWVQSLGKRASVTDGGHAAGDPGDHYIGRYILTTDNPETAYSFMKTHDVSYLLIDSSDLGKYGAYSRIGSNEDYDRFSYLPVGVKDSRQTQELNNKTVQVYPMGSGVDEDIIYDDGSGERTFIPGPSYNSAGNPSYKAFVGGVILESSESDGSISFEQPEVVFIYNNEQIRIPLRYVYVGGELIDFGSGVEGTFFVVPRVSQGNQGISIDETGAGVYLSPKVSDGLFAQLYLMDDPQDKYSEIELVHSENDFIINSLNSQGANVGDFVYFQGFRGPIKIWDVDYPEGTETYDEFLDMSAWGKVRRFGGLDYLFE